VEEVMAWLAELEEEKEGGPLSQREVDTVCDVCRGGKCEGGVRREA